MDKKNIPDIPVGQLKDLCDRVEQTDGKPVLTPLQFEALADDIFRRIGEPLYLDNLVHGDDRPGVYVCGRKSGVTFSDIVNVP